MKRLGMQELVLSSSPPSPPGVAVEALEFRLVLPQKQQLHQVLQQASFRSQHRHPSASGGRYDFGVALGEEFGGHKGNMREHEGYPTRGGSRRASFGSQDSSRNTGVAAFPGANRFVAFEFFSSPEVEAAVAEAFETGESNTAPTRMQRTNETLLLAHVCVPYALLLLFRPYGLARFAGCGSPILTSEYGNWHPYAERRVNIKFRDKVDICELILSWMSCVIGTAAETQKNWLRDSFGQFVLECVPVQKLQGLYKPYEHHRSDVFSRLAFSVSVSVAPR